MFTHSPLCRLQYEAGLGWEAQLLQRKEELLHCFDCVAQTRTHLQTKGLFSSFWSPSCYNATLCQSRNVLGGNDAATVQDQTVGQLLLQEEK